MCYVQSHPFDIYAATVRGVGVDVWVLDYGVSLTCQHPRDSLFGLGTGAHMDWGTAQDVHIGRVECEWGFQNLQSHADLCPA